MKSIKKGRFFVLFIVVFTLVLSFAFISKATPPDRSVLKYLGSFPTSGFSPDGLVYDPKGNCLIAVHVASPFFSQGMYVVDLDGTLKAFHPFPDDAPCVGLDITRVMNGSKAGHFFVLGFSDVGNPDQGDFEAEVEALELDRDLTPLSVFHVTIPYGGDPGDGVAYNPFSRTLLITDQWANKLHEITIDGEWVGSTEIAAGCSPYAGITFNVSTGTYFGVEHNGRFLAEFDGDTNLIRTFDLRAYGVQQPVGVTCGQGKIFIADQLSYPFTGTGGFIHVFRSPTPY